MTQTTKTQNLTPIELYYKRIDEGAIIKDPLQVAAIEALTLIHEEIKRQAKRNIPFWPFKSKPKIDERIKGLYMYGSVGRGKSMVMDIFYDTLPDNIPKTRTHFHAFMIDLHDFMHERRESGEAKKGSTDAALLQFAEKTAKEASVLCFDEFHVTDVADAMLLSRLFSALFDHGVIVVATSNWSPDNLYEGGLQRELFIPFIELLKERMAIIELDGARDYRLEFLRDAGVYFYPLGSASDKKADELFEALSGGMEPFEKKIEVKGREIVIENAVRGMARIKFADLCEKPLGAEDYMAIAQQYHTLLLEGIPKLNYDRRNEAKRFMTLIDVLYEQNIHVVFTADAPVNGLYLGHDHAFEFERTVSRLMEMQSEKYLSQASHHQDSILTIS